MNISCILNQDSNICILLIFDGIIVKMNGADKELEIKVKKIIIHKRLHALLQEIKKEYTQASEQPK